MTGASAGIGRAFAEVLAARGFDVVLCARRERRLADLAARLEEHYGVRAHVVATDLAQAAGPAQVVAELGSRGIVVDALVSNAGHSITGSFASVDWERQAAVIQILVTAYAELTRSVLPGMLERRWGRIVLVASVSGLMPATPRHALNAAAKAFTVQLALALAGETRGTGVHVTALCPGFTRTELHELASLGPEIARVPAFLWMDPERVARSGWNAVSRGRPLVVPGWPNRVMTFAARLLPMSLAAVAARRGALGLGGDPSAWPR